MPGSWPISEEAFVIQLSFVVNFFCPQINIFSLFKHMFYPCKKFYMFPATGVRTSNFTLPKAENDDFVESVITLSKVWLLCRKWQFITSSKVYQFVENHFVLNSIENFQPTLWSSTKWNSTKWPLPDTFVGNR